MSHKVSPDSIFRPRWFNAESGLTFPTIAVLLCKKTNLATKGVNSRRKVSRTWQMGPVYPHWGSFQSHFISWWRCPLNIEMSGVSKEWCKEVKRAQYYQSWCAGHHRDIHPDHGMLTAYPRKRETHVHPLTVINIYASDVNLAASLIYDIIYRGTLVLKHNTALKLKVSAL